jgi:hypothetical protein
VRNLQRYPAKHDAQESPQTIFTPRAGAYHCARQSGNVMARLNVPWIRAEAQHLGIGFVLQYLFDDRLKRAFVAEIAGAKVSVKTDSHMCNRTKPGISV